MKNFKKICKKVLIATLALAMMFVFNGSNVALAATTPSLGAATTFGILASTFTRNIGITSIAGDLGYTTLSGSGSNTTTGATHVADGTYSTAGTDQGTALVNLNGQGCTFTFPAGPIDLATDTTHGPIGIYTPGVYCTTSGSAASIGTGGITLNGLGTYIFRINGAFTTVANSAVALAGGASSCDVFWTPTSATTLGANTAFVGTDIDNSGITVGSTALWFGRALSFGGTVTTDTDTISSACSMISPAIAQAAAAGGGPLTTEAPPLIDIVKVPSLLSLLSTGGGSVAFNYAVTNVGTVPMSNITVTDNKCPSVTYVSGDTNNDSKLDVNETWMYRCVENVSQTATNTATATGQANGFTAIKTANATVIVGSSIIPPLIHLVKRPNVFVLPVGGGPVTYSYAVTNPGTVPLSNVSVIDNKCTGLPGLVSGNVGDTNHNGLLDPGETWMFTCQTYLTQTTVNTGTAQGSANGFTAVDYSSATVAVAPPGLPTTGFPPQENNLWNMIISSGILIFLFAFFIARKKELI